MISVRVLLASVLLVVASPGFVRAEDMDPAPTPAQTLIAKLEAAKVARDNAAWTAALAEVGGLWGACDEANKKALATAVGHALKAKDEGVQIAAIQAFVSTKDGEAAWKGGLKGALPDAKTEAAAVPELRALEALKDLHPDGAVQPLLALFEKAKDPKVSAAALGALGGYERSKQRVAILEALIKNLRLAMPSAGGGQSGKNAAPPTPRWTEMEPHVLPTLNGLTAQKVGDLAAWLLLYEENKKKPAALFLNPLD